MFAPEFYRQYKSWIQKAASNWKKSYLTCKENNEPLHNYKGIADTKEVLYSAMKKEIAEALGVDADALWGNEYENNPGYRQLILDQLKKNHQNPPVTLNDFSHIHKQRTGTIKAYENYLKIIEKYTALPANEREERLAKLFGGMEKEDFKAYLDDEQVSVEFLQKILELLYNAGEYAFIADFVLDKLESRIGRNDKRQFKIIAAHIYGSAPVGRYAEAVALLSSINEASFEEYADNKTAMISNILRNAFVLSESDKAAVTKLLYEVLNAYANICQHHPHYPAINYAYTYVMLDAIAPETNLSEEFDTPRQLFEDEDIQKSFNEASYYVRVSRMEFLMLLHAPIDAEKSKKELADTAPTEDMLRRTLRQLDFFKDKLKIYADSRPQEGYEVLYNALSAMLDAS